MQMSCLSQCIISNEYKKTGNAGFFKDNANAKLH